MIQFGNQTEKDVDILLGDEKITALSVSWVAIESDDLTIFGSITGEDGSVTVGDWHKDNVVCELYVIPFHLSLI